MEYDTLELTSPMIHGPAVFRLQEILDQLGHGIDPIDGIFGIETETALIEFQILHGLEADGVCRQDTWEALEDARNQAHVVSIVDKRKERRREKLLEKLEDDGFMEREE